jgi:hypothetical protein
MPDQTATFGVLAGPFGDMHTSMAWSYITYIEQLVIVAH